MTTPQPAHLWLYCFDNTEYLQTTFARLDITPAWAAQMVGAIAQMDALRLAQRPRQLYQMEYWDFTAITWTTRPDDLPTVDDGLSEADAAAIESFYDTLEDQQAVFCPTGTPAYIAGLDLPEQWVRGVTLRVQEDCIYWACHIKHDNSARLWTTDVTLSDLRCLARGALPVSAFVLP